VVSLTNLLFEVFEGGKLGFTKHFTISGHSHSVTDFQRPFQNADPVNLKPDETRPDGTHCSAYFGSVFGLDVENLQNSHLASDFNCG
jgi:hypothetical protein